MNGPTSPYQVLITGEVLSLERPSRRERELIPGFLDRLSQEPFHKGDFSQTDAVGRVVEVKLPGRYSLTYRTEQSEREVKVFRIERGGGGSVA